MGRNGAHLVRMAALFAAGLVVFLAVRQRFVPHDFGTYGHYRAGALDDARAKPIKFAGQRTCVECHSDVAERRSASHPAKVSCESCHGALAVHASGDSPATPGRPDGRAPCLTCHQKNVSKPAWFPQIVAAEHADEGPCTACHQPHSPGVS